MEAKDYIFNRKQEILTQCHGIDCQYERIASQVQTAQEQLRLLEKHKQKLCGELDVLAAMEAALGKEDEPEGGVTP